MVDTSVLSDVYKYDLFGLHLIKQKKMSLPSLVSFLEHLVYAVLNLSSDNQAVWKKYE